MAGCRQLTDEEINIVIECLEKPRDKALFVLGYTTGFRITELLSLKFSDVYDGKKVFDYVKVSRKNTKGKVVGRETPIHKKAKECLEKLIFVTDHSPEKPLFQSERRDGPISRMAAHIILKDAFNKAGLTGTLATHTMRKTFALRVYRGTKNDLIALKNSLNHSDIRTTVKYLPKDQESIEEAIKNIK